MTPGNLFLQSNTAILGSACHFRTFSSQQIRRVFAQILRKLSKTSNIIISKLVFFFIIYLKLILHQCFKSAMFLLTVNPQMPLYSEKLVLIWWNSNVNSRLRNKSLTSGGIPWVKMWKMSFDLRTHSHTQLLPVMCWHFLWKGSRENDGVNPDQFS